MKTRILIVLTLAISLVSHFSYGESNLSGLSSDKASIGKWEVKMVVEGAGEMPVEFEITQDENKTCSGVFKMMGNQTDMQNFKFDGQKNKLSFKADIGAVVLSFDLTITGDKLEGNVKASDGVKGKVTGNRQNK